MKRNIKFFTIVISLLLASSLVLIGCMYAITKYWRTFTLLYITEYMYMMQDLRKL